MSKLTKYTKDKQALSSVYEFPGLISGWNVRIQANHGSVSVRKNGTTVLTMTHQEAEILGEVLVDAAEDGRRRIRKIEKKRKKNAVKTQVA
jgi:hypothetical protein